MLYTAFILGLMGSFHCVGMCGPIAFLLPLDRTSAVRAGFQLSLYHVGRLLTYGILGVLFGLLGRSFYFFGFQQQLSIITGVIMIVAVLLPQQWLSKYTLSKPLYRLISKVKSSLGAQLKKRSPDTFFTIGFLNGFLPCGLVYMAIFGAIATGALWEGSLYMMIFGLGTVPLMTATAYFGNFLKGKARKKITRLIPVFVVLIGFVFIFRGLGLGIPYLSPKPMKEVQANYECHDVPQQYSNSVEPKNQ